MAPASTSKPARAAGPASNGNSRSPAVQPAPKVSKAGTSSTPNANAHANNHTTAQLLPVATTGNDNNEGPYDGLPQPDNAEDQQHSEQQYKDGRIRNPVPSKLKGKTSASSGRFSVMHMDIRGKDMAADRDLAAKRTSENTAMAAQKAFESGYQPHRKSNWMRVTEEQADPSVPFTGTTPYNHALYGLKPAPNPSRERSSIVETPRPLFPEEVKEEQARLLTLLRTLQPLTVVDQLCKALAYFGGIPDAPPPKEGRSFPESAEANGSGAVFVGWVAEIFPDLDAQGRRKPRPFVAPSLPPARTTEKRGRGRPKGSKASKVRSDKGIKKGSKKNPILGALDANETVHDNSWVDVDESILDDEDEGDDDVGITGARVRHTPEPPSAADAEATASAKRRGRPKGSKNRPKDGTADEFTPNPAPVSALFSIGKKSGARGGRSKGINRPRPNKDSTAITKLTATANSAAPVATPELQVPTSQAAAPTEPVQPGEDYSLAALKAFNEENSTEAAHQASSFQPVNTLQAPSASQEAAAKPTPAKGSAKVLSKKRKRNAKEIEPAAQLASGTAPTVPDPPVGITQPAVTGTSSSIDLTAVGPSAPPVPPAPKRQRKTKAKAKTAPASTPVLDQTMVEGPSQVSQTHVVRAVPTPATQSTDTQMYISPTIEELEAQLEQHDAQSPPPAYTEFTSTQSASQTKAPPLSTPSQPQSQVNQFQSQVPSNPKKVHQTSKAEPQRTAALQKQQYQQQSSARTASPSVTQVNTTSQSASPSIGQAHSVSPSLHQHRTTNAQTPTSLNPQVQSQTARNTQSYYPQQTTSTAATYGQQPDSQYSSPQPAKQQFNVPQPQQQQSYGTTQQSSQQQPSYVSQQPQYTQQKQQPYSAQPQQSYTSPQQQYSSQRLQQPQYTNTSSGTTPQSLAAQSPSFGTSSASDYSSGDGNFRTTPAAGMNFNSTAHGSNQASNASRSHNLYSNSGTGSYANASQPASSYSTASTSRRNLPATTGNHTSVQNVQSLPQNLGGFSTDFGSMGFGDNLMSSLENTTGSHSNLGLNAASYNMGAGNVARSSTGANNFGFDSTIRNDGTPYFGSLRR
ncbi:hypothetical protein N0V82_000490 [Gnomoniopsis sp. IMI 355080]|nr:hypothetical protein N0V82_000490 [Gnomoniopsis sp. IMI 355080]